MGLDLLRDSHLLYIAKEGLKAPLPDHWKPCQSKNGEIFYYNVETQESTFEHPCDNYYRGLYLKEKNKKNSNKLGLAEINNDKKGKPLIPPIKQLPSPMFGQQKKADLPDFSNKTPGLIDKSKDPLIQMEKTKKLEVYKEKKEKEFQEIKRSLDEEYEKKIRDAQQKNSLALQDLEVDYLQQTRIEEDKLEKEIKKAEAVLKANGKNMENMENGVRKELEIENARKLEAEIKRMEEEYREFERESERMNDAIIKEEMERIKGSYQGKIEELDREIENMEKNLKISRNMKGSLRRKRRRSDKGLNWNIRRIWRRKWRSIR